MQALAAVLPNNTASTVSKRCRSARCAWLCMESEAGSTGTRMLLLLPTCASSDSISSSFARTSPTTCGTLQYRTNRRGWKAAISNRNQVHASIQCSCANRGTGTTRSLERLLHSQQQAYGLLLTTLVAVPARHAKRQ
jgi:hypothetical protein